MTRERSVFEEMFRDTLILFFSTLIGVIWILAYTEGTRTIIVIGCTRLSGAFVNETVCIEMNKPNIQQIAKIDVLLAELQHTPQNANGAFDSEINALRKQIEKEKTNELTGHVTYQIRKALNELEKRITDSQTPEINKALEKMKTAL